MTTQQPPQPTPALSAEELVAIADWLAESMRVPLSTYGMALWAEKHGERLIAAARAYAALVPLVEAAERLSDAVLLAYLEQSGLSDDVLACRDAFDAALESPRS